jgi:pyruvate decarboxylase
MKKGMGQCSVGEYLASRLEQIGISDYFTVPGDFNLILLDQLLKNPQLRMIGCCNELNAGYAAEGYARSHGVAALVVTYSVGGLSALNAVACAYSENLPLLAISGGINSDSEADGHLIHHALGEVRYDYQRQIYEHVTAGAYAIRRLEDATASETRLHRDRLQPGGPERARAGPAYFSNGRAKQPRFTCRRRGPHR